MPRLTPKEKSSAEYLSHRLEVRRIWLEKVLLFIIIGGISGGITFAGKLYLETYKSDLIKRDFLLKSRMEGIKEISNAYSQLVNNLFAYPINNTDDAKKTEYCKIYKRNLSFFMNICNKWSVLFSEEFDRDLQCHYYVHEAVAYEKVILNNEHYNFLSVATQHFDRIIVKALIEETLGEKQNTLSEEWDFDETSKKDLRKMKSEEFFNFNYNKYKNENK